jgi:hypothetical protein
MGSKRRLPPIGRKVGIRIVTFEACSGFTHVTARQIAQPPEATFVTRLQPVRLPGQAARQLPDQSTTLWVDSSSTGDSRLRGARPTRDIELRSAHRPKLRRPRPPLRRCRGRWLCRAVSEALDYHVRIQGAHRSRNGVATAATFDTTQQVATGGNAGGGPLGSMRRHGRHHHGSCTRRRCER